MSIYVYKKGEEGPATQGANTEEASTGSAKINLNSATKDDLQQVPGIGESKATAIIEYREKEGLFQTIEDLKMFQASAKNSREIKRIFGC